MNEVFEKWFYSPGVTYSKLGTKAGYEEAFRAGMLAAAEIAENTGQEWERFSGAPRRWSYSCADAIRDAASS